ncbi:MAG: DUF4340 domain-containing protein [Acidobacteriota bacterium]
MRGLKSTLALVVVAAALGGYVYFVESERPDSGVEPRTKVFALEADKIQEMRITSSGETTVVRKVDGTWRITEPIEADADQTEMSSLTSNLASLEENRVVDEQAADLGLFGLATPDVQVSFTAEGGVSGAIAFGDTTPTGGDLYAVKPGEKRVFLVPAYLETTFARRTFDLRDKRALRFERDQIDGLEIAAGTAKVTVRRDGSEWALTSPVAARADYSAVEAVITRASSAAMTEIVGGADADLKTYGLDRPAFTLTLAAGSTRATLAVSRDIDGRRYARDESRPLVFAVDPTLAKDLDKTVDDLRDKDIFEFRTYNIDRLHIAQGGDLVELVKSRGAAGAGETWQRTRGGVTAAVELAAVDDLLSKLSGLRAQSFAATAPRPDASTVRIEASYDGGKFERVRLLQGNDDAFAARDGEPGAARLDATALGEALKAIDRVNASQVAAEPAGNATPGNATPPTP